MGVPPSTIAGATSLSLQRVPEGLDRAAVLMWSAAQGRGVCDAPTPHQPARLAPPYATRRSGLLYFLTDSPKPNVPLNVFVGRRVTFTSAARYALDVLAW